MIDEETTREEKLSMISEMSNHRGYAYLKKVIEEDIESCRLALERSSDMLDVTRIQARIHEKRQLLHMFES